MYHVKADKRAYKSAILIIQSLYDLLQEKSFDDITITEIHQRANVGRATFYRLFDNKKDVLGYAYELAVKKVLETYSNSTKDEPFFKYLISKMFGSELLKIMIENRFLGYIYDIHLMNIHWLHEFSPELDDYKELDEKYLASTITALIISCIEIWYMNGKKENVDEMYDILKKEVKFAQLII